LRPIFEHKQAHAVPLLDLQGQYAPLMHEMHRGIEQVMASGQWILGPHVRQFEQNLAAYCGTAEAIGMSSGTDALLASLMAMDIGPGDEVITTPFTFFSTASSIARVGAKPVFVDIDPRTCNIEVESLEGAIGAQTKAILPVHMYGLAAEMNQIEQLAKRYGLWVIADAAQALGGWCGDRRVGSMGHVSCVSFYPTKVLPAIGDAGACLTNDPELAERLRRIRGHGLSEDYTFTEIGGNFRIDALHAAMLDVKLPHLDQWAEGRRRVAERYNRQLEDLPVATPLEAEGRHHIYNYYTIRVRGHVRDTLQQHLDACGIGTRIYYPRPLHLQPCFQYLGYQRGNFPEAETAAKDVLSLPIFPHMTAEQQEQVIEAVRDFYFAE
jgi:dTDP-4-amino-4,6-dideoxygalactose transaminase